MRWIKRNFNIHNVTLINIEWNNYNGFIFTILNIESSKPINMDSALFGINFSESFITVSFLFFYFEYFKK